MNCVTEVVKLALPLAGGPSCWNPTTSYVGRTSANEVVGILGISVVSLIGWSVRNDSRSNFLRV